ncbi:hypothetical protein HYS30_02885 [Candidatus Peregrinibacteria bacterium]|nr:hypothetical protein [Candidatus Peregrinibacteria bacterium]
MRLVENKEHPLTHWKFLTKHEATGTLRRIVCNLDTEVDMLIGGRKERERLEIIGLPGAGSEENSKKRKPK